MNNNIMTNLCSVYEFIENIPKNLIQNNNINKKNITQLFICFLQKNNAYANFKFNHYNFRKRKTDWASYPFSTDEMNETELISNARGFISAAFVWGRTIEGQRFWSNLHENWLKIINMVLLKSTYKYG